MSLCCVFEKHACYTDQTNGTMIARVYEELNWDLDEFRLLRLSPATSFSAPIVVSLLTCSLRNDSPAYDAVSYEWGSSDDRCVITANGGALLVTKTLRTALRYLRHERVERTLWIDGVCIDQNNVVERNSQVLKMGKIFSQAHGVHIWLGESTEDSDAAMELMARLPIDTGVQNDLGVVSMILANPVGGMALIKLLRRSYWERMWILQEIVLAERATVQCGAMRVPWGSFQKLDSVSADQGFWLSSQIREGWVWELRKAVFGNAQFFMDKSQASSITNLLEPTRRLKSSDPRDKLYALIGLCGPAMGLVPNYSRTVRDVYTDFARNFISVTRSASLLLTAGIWKPENGPDIGLPSWVSDSRGIHGVDIRYLAANHLAHFNASHQDGDMIVEFPNGDGEQQNQLKIRACLIDTVADVLPLEKGEACRSGLLSAFGLPVGRAHPSEAPQLQALFRTLIFDDPTLHEDDVNQNPGQKANERYTRLILGFTQDVALLRSQTKPQLAPQEVSDFLESFKLVDASLQSQFSRLAKEDPDELHWLRQEYLVRSEETIDGTSSCMFSTRMNYIGKGPRDMQAGDCLAILYGCRLPVVLRPFGPYYRLVGPSYVDGLMSGEIFSCRTGLALGLQDGEIIIV